MQVAGEIISYLKGTAHQQAQRKPAHLIHTIKTHW